MNRWIRTMLLALALSALAAPVIAQTLVTETVSWESPLSQGGLYTSLALDAQGNPHISFYSESTGAIVYARKTEGDWVKEFVDTTVDSSQYTTSIRLDSTGSPHVAYYDATAGDLKYARKTAGVWTIEVADAAGNTGESCALALAPSGNANISYFDRTNQSLRYARKAGPNWTRETVSVPGFGGYSSIALDSSQNPRISFAGSLGSVVYASKSLGAWTIENVITTLGLYRTSIALDAAGNPHIAVGDVSGYQLSYAQKSGGVWTIETVDGTTTGVGEYPSLALDAAGNPHVSYYDQDNGNLRYAHKSGGVWFTETLNAAANFVGLHTSLALDASGNPHVSYQDASAARLTYTYAPSLRVSSPLPGTTWPVGSRRTIRWSTSGGLEFDNADVYLSVDGGITFSQVRNEARDPEIVIRVPHSPTRFASIKVTRASPYLEAYMDSFFTIDAAIALSKFEARALDRGEGGAKTAPSRASDIRGIELNWETAPGRDDDIRYRVERANSDDPAAAFVPLHAGPLDANTFVDSVQRDTGARYRLVAINGLGDEYLLGESSIAPTLTLDKSLVVFPNPARDGRVEITFRVPSVGFSRLDIFDLSGRRVREFEALGAGGQVASLRWDGTDSDGRDVAAGSYAVRLSTRSDRTVAISTERIVIVR